MQEAMVVSYQKITHLQKISYHHTSQRRYDIYQIKIRDMRGIMRCKVLQDNTSNKHLRCIDSILQDMLSIDNILAWHVIMYVNFLAYFVIKNKELGEKQF